MEIQAELHIAVGPDVAAGLNLVGLEAATGVVMNSIDPMSYRDII